MSVFASLKSLNLSFQDMENREIVHTEKAIFDDGLVLESGKIIKPLEIAYETYGRLNSAGTNAVLICHALSGSANAAFWHEGAKKPGWWDMYIGPGKAIDTNKYFVVCSNVIGGCYGSSGPSMINPDTGREFGLEFPVVTINDMVNAQVRLMEHLGIKKWLCVIGGSMGGMQVLSWAFHHSEKTKGAIPIATTMQHTAQQIAFNAVGRQAIMRDPNWNNGNYYGKALPFQGLAVARMIGHITYLSDEAMNIKFARRLREKEAYGYDFSIDFEIESYLDYQGDSFVRRFDANSYLYLTKAIDYFEIYTEIQDPDRLKAIDVDFLVLSFSSDWLYPPSQVEEIAKFLESYNKDVSYCCISSDYGHDSFLLYNESQDKLMRGFLDHLYANA